MAKSLPSVEKALADLQRLILRPPSDEPTQVVMSGEVPEDLQSDDCKMLWLFRDERRALEKARSLLAEDLRFEHLKESAVKDATWRFACLSHVQRKGDLVPSFVADHAREPMQRTCFFPIELLTIKKEVELYGVRLIPRDAADLPATLLGPDPRPMMGSVIAVECSGTNYDKMSSRARADAERALRLLRATLREYRFMPDRQLRFRLGQAGWFDDSAGGWTSPPDQGWELELDDELLRHATSQEISTLPKVPSNDVERRAEFALRWFERAQLAVDPTIELLYLFFALETILGDTSEGLKAPALAVRRAMLGLLTSEGFTHPARTYLLYDEVRSAAVHGEKPPDISQREVDRFAWDVRRALNEFLQYARTAGFTKRAHVRKALDSHERRKGIVDALLEQNPKLWGKYLETAAENASQLTETPPAKE